MGNKYLYTVPYKDFFVWDVKRYSNNTISSYFGISTLGQHIQQENHKVVLSDMPNDIFDILGISNEVGMFDAYSEVGSKFNQPYKLVKNSWIAYNPYRVNVGSIGLKTDDLYGKWISPAYVVFSCKGTLVPEFLFALMKTDWFNKQVRENTSGSVRQNLTFDALSKIKIPVPPIEEQNRLVSAYNERIGQKSIGDISREDDFNDLFVDLLGAYGFELKKSSGFLFDLINSSSLYRWDSWEKSTGVKSAKYIVVPFEKIVLGKPQYGANVKGVDKKCDYRYIRITDINEDGTLSDDIKYPEKIDPKFILQQNDFLIARSGNTVGKTFLYKTQMGPAIYAGYLVKYTLDTGLVLPEYVLYYTKSVLFKNWVFLNQRIAGQPNINGQEYLSFPIILPPVDVQKEIVKSMRAIFDEIRREIDLSKKIMVQAQQEFEKAIFAG